MSKPKNMTPEQEAAWREKERAQKAAYRACQADRGWPDDDGPEAQFLRPPHSRGGAGRGQGRKALAAGEETVTFSIRMTARQREKLERLGGAKWVRERIERAKGPNMSNHTPGHWLVERDGVAVSMTGQVVIASPAPDEANYSEAAANARLIAAIAKATGGAQ